MALNEYVTGTETVSTTEWSLTTDTAGPDADTTHCICSVWIDFAAVAGTDLFEVALYEKVRPGDTQRLVDKWQISVGTLAGEAIWVSPALHVKNGWDWTLKKVNGTDRTINWSVRTVT